MDDGYQGIFLLTHHISFNLYSLYCQTPVLSLGLEVDLTSTGNNDNNNSKKNPRLRRNKLFNQGLA